MTCIKFPTTLRQFELTIETDIGEWHYPENAHPNIAFNIRDDRTGGVNIVFGDLRLVEDSPRMEPPHLPYFGMDTDYFLRTLHRDVATALSAKLDLPLSPEERTIEVIETPFTPSYAPKASFNRVHATARAKYVGCWHLDFSRYIARPVNTQQILSRTRVFNIDSLELARNLILRVHEKEDGLMPTNPLTHRDDEMFETPTWVLAKVHTEDKIREFAMRPMEMLTRFPDWTHHNVNRGGFNQIGGQLADRKELHRLIAEKLLEVLGDDELHIELYRFGSDTLFPEKLVEYNKPD